MKNTRILVSFLTVSFVLGSLTASFARPRGGSNFGKDYLIGAHELSPWNAGVYYNGRKRLVSVGGTRYPAEMETQDMLAYVGLDILSQWNVHVSIGEGRTEITGDEASDRKIAFGVGTHVNLLDHEIEDPFILEDRFRVNAGVDYNWRKTEWLRQDLEWTELVAYLTVSLVNDIQGDKRFLPESLAIFGGPMYSEILGDDISDSPDQQMGYIVGIELFYTKRISMHLNAESFEKTGITAGINLQF